ncbi:MAG: response regulator [Desulfobacteria bacterium]
MDTNKVSAEPRIAIIEDDESLREALALFLRMKGWSVETFGSDEEASGVANWGDFTVVLCDLLLPGGDGLSVLRRVRRASDTVVTVLITTHRGPDVAAQAGSAGVDRILVKPFSTKELEDSLPRLTENDTGRGTAGAASSR